MAEHVTASDPGDWMHLFHDQFAKETDRAKVILAAAILDEALSVLLRTHLVACAAANDDLFDGSTAPLAAFSSRIDFAYRVGLISRRMCRDLHLVRKIRNDFAHNVSGCDFDSSSVRNRIVELKKSFSELTAEAEGLETFGDNPRGHFQNCVGWMVWYIRSLITRSGQVGEAVEEWGYHYAAAAAKHKSAQSSPPSQLTSGEETS
jgi:DNA-binding MltR family transcriptional regulator